MHRSLQINVFEGAPAGQEPASGGPRTGSRGGDPTPNEVMPPPKDTSPEGHRSSLTGDPTPNEVMPPPKDPTPNEVMPPPKDTSPGTAYWTYGPGGQPAPWGGWQPVAASVQAGGCAPVACCGSSDQKKAPPRPGRSENDYSGFVIVRMAPGIESDTAKTLWELAWDLDLVALMEILAIDAEPKPEDGTNVGQEESVQQARQGGGAADLGRLGDGDRLRWHREKKGRGDEPPGSPPEPPPLPPPPPEGVLESRPLIENISGCGSREAVVTRIRELEGEAATSAFPPLHSLACYWRVDLRQHPGRVEEVVALFRELPSVDLAYRELFAVDPGTGDRFGEDQGYLDSAPVGIGARWAGKKVTSPGSDEDRVRLCDLEQRWELGHDEFKQRVPKLLYGKNRAEEENRPGHHGTAVLGQLASTVEIDGAAEVVGSFHLTSHYRSREDKEPPITGDPHPFAGTSGHVAAALFAALSDEDSPAKRRFRRGDIVLLEVQRGLLPTEIDAADFDAVRLASGLGVIVVEAAGNGGFDLDAYVDPDTRYSLRRGDSGFRDSGAIMVGAAYAAPPHDRAGFSNYGSRVDCYAWGDSVTTCGYGDLSGDARTNYYTNTFAGTSSASPVIAGAAALVQGLHREHAGDRLGPLEMRSILSDPATGTPQGPNVPGRIGVMPDLEAITCGSLQLVADVYMRSSVCDDGSRPVTRDEISSSPDLSTWSGPPPTANAGGAELATDPAPGVAIDPANPIAGPDRLRVHLRNRGGGEAKNAKVRLFASAAATLITPEWWQAVGEATVKQVDPGDLPSAPGDLDLQGMTLSGPQGGTEWPAGIVPPWSFLAVRAPDDAELPNGETPVDRGQGLPPGPPYFDWDEYRAFLRGPGVAWRNVYAIQAAGSKQPIDLAFLLAGTPEAGHAFGFEVIQRLPRGARVDLIVPQGIAGKVKRKLPGLPELPQRARVSLGHLYLTAGLRARAAFKVTPGSNGLKTGHSLAIRQLWRGEEVGRITWWFV